MISNATIVVMILWSANGFIAVGPSYNEFERCNESLTIVTNASNRKVEGVCIVGQVK